jgi:hypothetical protein
MQILHKVRLFLSIYFGKQSEIFDSGTGASFILILLACFTGGDMRLLHRAVFVRLLFFIVRACVLQYGAHYLLYISVYTHIVYEYHVIHDA